MIDLSHLTEEEQSMIMTVLKRDEELKKAEEERIKQLQKTSAPVESRLKYLTGEWFYEAKSLRHRDKIHGSEIILASMKQRKAGSLDGSLSRPRAVSGKVSDITPPPKPARLLVAPTRPQENSESLSASDAEKERLNSVVRSPGRPRHNPFNRASLILEVEKTEKQLSNGNQEAEKASEAEPLSPLKIHMTADSTSHNSAGSATSEGSSLGFRPVPKKRTFLSRRSQNSLTGSDVSVPGQQGHVAGSKVTAPAPQGSLQHGSSWGSNQSSQGALDVQSQKITPSPICELKNNVTPVSPSSQQLNTLSHLSHKPLKDLTLVSTNTELEREKEAHKRAEEPSDNSVRTPSLLKETESSKVPLRPLSEPKPLRLLDLRPATHSDNDRDTDKSYTGGQSRESLIQREFVSVGPPQGREKSDGPFSEPLSIPLSPSSELTAPTHHQPSQHAAFKLIEMQDKMIRTSSVGTAIRQEDLSLPPSAVDQWMHHELHNPGDKPDKHVHKKQVGRKPASKSAPRSPQPTGEEGDSISKVLEWFSRSTDSNDWLETESDQPDMEEDVIGSVKTDTDDRPTFESRSQQTEGKAPEMKRKLLHVDPSLDIQRIGEGVSVCLTPEVEDGSQSESSVNQPPDQSPLNTERSYQPKRRMSEAERLRAAYRKEFKQLMLYSEEDVVDRQEDVKKVSGLPAKAAGPQVTTQEVIQKEEVQDENQPPKISHLKSFWEKGNIGPKILISRSITDKGQKQMEKERELAEKSHRTVPDPESGASRKNPGDGKEDERLSLDTQQNSASQDVRSVQPKVSPYKQEVYTPKQTVVIAPSKEICTLPTWDVSYTPGAQTEEDDLTLTEEDLRRSPMTVDRRSSEAEIVFLTRLHPQPDSVSQSRLSPEPQRFSPSTLSPQPELLLQPTVNPQPVKLSPAIPKPKPEMPSSPNPLPELLFQPATSPNSKKFHQSRHKVEKESEQFAPKTQQSNVNEETKEGKELKGDFVQSSVSSKKQDHTVKDKGNSPHTLKQVPPQQDSKADKIKQLKCFWEQEKSRPIFYTGKSKEAGDSSVTQISSSAPGKLNKRFTKSEFDLRSICNESDSDHKEDSNLSSDRKRQNFTVFTINQRLEKSSPGLGTNRSQFKNLRNFWGEATSNSRGPISSDEPKSLKKKEPMDAQNSMLELKQCVDPDFYSNSVPSQSQKVSARPPLDESRLKKTSSPSSPSSPSRPPFLVRGNKDREHQSRSKLIGAGSGAMIDTKEHQSKSRSVGVGSGAMIDTKANFSPQITVESELQRAPGVPRGSEQDFTKEEKALKPQSTSGKESWSHKARKDSFGNSSGRASSLRRATSMFTLDMNEEQDQTSLLYPKKVDISSFQAKRTQGRRQSADKQALHGPRKSSKSSDESESLTPRARAFVPRDYRHYLGITEKTRVHTALALAVKEQKEELDLSGELVRSSTLVGSEECYSRRNSKITQRPLALWSNQGSTDTGRESSFSASERASSSASETWSNSRTSSNRDNYDEDQDHIQKALKRAQARPRNLAKSLEDITASMPPRQDRRLAPLDDLRRSSDASTLPSPSSSLYSDTEHLKKMSKSVPSFLQNESDGRDTDSASEDSYHGGRQNTGRSMTKLSSSSSMASVSSLSGSVMTMYSGDYGGVEVQGNIQFSINYVQKLREFHIFVSQCQDLAAVDPKRGRSDPYVKSYLVPDKANLGKRKTSVKKKTVNPIFNELLRYRLRMEYLRTQTLILSVWHHDTFGRNSFLGEVDVDLSKWDFNHTQMNYLALKSRATSSLQPSDDRGEMKLAIRFLPQVSHSLGKDPPSNKGEVHIWVKDCKNLPLIRGATVDPYVKCFVLPDTSRKSRQKTRVLRRTVEPVFNHTMVYDGFRQEDLKEACVELTVWDRDKLASNFLGGLRLGPGTGRSYGAVVNWMDSKADEVALWERMMTSPNEWVEDVLPLRMLTTAKTVLK